MRIGIRHRSGGVILPILLASLIGCGGSEPSRSAAAIAIAGGDQQNAQVSTAVQNPPSVLVKDESGDPVPGIRVTFTVASGGGTVQGATALSRADGTAVVGNWILGTTVGTNTLNASVAGLPSVTFTATSTSGAPASITAATPVSQSALAGAAVPVDPAVLVADAFGNGVPGVVVTFAVTAGSGSITGNPVTTANNGIATLGSWVLDASPGPNTISASVPPSSINGSPVIFQATGSTSAYDIDLRFLGSINSAQQQAFLNARARLQALIVNDLPDVSVVLPAGFCISTQPAMNEMVDDLVIFAQVVAIDGPGQILGRAGPCRTHVNGLPSVGIMEFDEADLASLQASGMLQAVILHEMLHVVGFGSIWSSKQLLSGAGGADPFFTGALARTAFLTVGGNTYVGNKVPVENTGGAGTRDAHWRESVFQNELMTGFLNSGSNPLSLVTAESLEDMGYTIDAGAIDAFVLAAPPGIPGTRAAPVMFNLGDDVWRGPMMDVDPTGRIPPFRKQ